MYTCVNHSVEYSIMSSYTRLQWFIPQYHARVRGREKEEEKEREREGKRGGERKSMHVCVSEIVS